MTRHLIHIGFPKAGSTSLQDWFAAHPEMSSIPNTIAGAYEAHSFAQQIANEPTPPAWRVTSSELFTYPAIEASPDTPLGVPIQIRQERVCAALADLFPTSSILIVTRGLRASVFSAYSQYVRAGGTRSAEATFRDHAVDFADTWDYDRVVDLWSTAFQGRVCVLPFELLREDPTAFIHAIEDFLELEHTPVDLPRLNPSLSAKELRWYPRLSALVFALTRRAPGLAARYRYRIGSRAIRPVLERLPGRPVTASDVPPELVAACSARAAKVRERPEFAKYRTEYGG